MDRVEVLSAERLADKTMAWSAAMFMVHAFFQASERRPASITIPTTTDCPAAEVQCAVYFSPELHRCMEFGPFTVVTQHMTDLDADVTVRELVLTHAQVGLWCCRLYWNQPGCLGRQVHHSGCTLGQLQNIARPSMCVA